MLPSKMSILRLFVLQAIFCVCLVNLTTCFDLNLTAKEVTEFHSLFKRYNKPAAVQEIKTIHGDTYKCVNFYDQPAFDDPLLNNYSYHQELHSQTSKVFQENPFKGLWANGEGCPAGTVPIRKYTRNEFIRTQALFQKLYPTDGNLPGRYRASVHTKDDDPMITFYGASAYLVIYNFSIDISQYTASYTLIRAGNDQLQFGWTVNPTMYPDSKTRIFVTTKVDDSVCFNLLCGSYVHTNKDVPIDTVLERSSERGAADALEIKAAIVKDPKSGVWQLYGTDTLLGYWPTEKLNGLKGPAVYLEWGGEAYNPKGLVGPPMGSGFFPAEDPALDGYARQISKYLGDGSAMRVGTTETESLEDKRVYYKVIDPGYVDDDNGHIVFFGGPGDTLG